MQQSYLKMIDVKGVTGVSQVSENDTWTVLFALECRGLEPVQWIPKGDFSVTTSGGTVFESVEFDEDGVWTGET